MKIFSVLALLGIVCSAGIASGALAETNTAKVSGTLTNAMGGVIPQSIFDQAIGKDPFFPNRSVAAAVPKATTSEFRTTDFTLNGITPLGARPFAIINGRTFEKGESGEVKVPSGGKVMIRLVEIKEDTVMVQIESSPQPVELRMRPGF